VIETVKDIFAKEHIDSIALLPFSACRVTLPRLLEELSFVPKSVILFLMPYYVDTPKNFSAYAASEDYHFFVKELKDRLLPCLSDAFPSRSFAIFADHSPIDERHAAVLGGLGIFGKNGLLLTEKYSSFQFIGEVISDLPIEGEEAVLFPLRSCEDCGACRAACPTGILRGEGTDCLSAITQKKGELSPSERSLMRRYQTAWGCDICQNVCPYTKRAKQNGTLVTPIPFFHRNRVLSFTEEMLKNMDKETFSRRAFGWRGRAVAERNAKILAEADDHEKEEA